LSFTLISLPLLGDKQLCVIGSATITA